jgi:hypothetical protein
MVLTVASTDSRTIEWSRQFVVLRKLIDFVNLRFIRFIERARLLRTAR